MEERTYTKMGESPKPIEVTDERSPEEKKEPENTWVNIGESLANHKPVTKIEEVLHDGNDSDGSIDVE
jgi:hypothetical protein